MANQYYKKVGLSINQAAFKNVIKHTNSHNQIKEEDSMWSQHDRRREGQFDSSYSSPSSSSRQRLYSDEPTQERPPAVAGPWTRELLRYELQQPDRWGHAGYAELYPEEFRQDIKTGTENGDPGASRKKHTNKERKRRKEKDNRSNDDVKRTDARDSNATRHRKHKSKGRKRRHSSDSWSDSQSDEPKQRPKHKTHGSTEKHSKERKSKRK